MLRALVVVWIVVASALAHAEPEMERASGRWGAGTVAMLPLDGEKRLEIYGQPVASEIGRALKTAGLDVVIVGAKMAVPDRAQLIVDGTIKAGKGDAITLSMRIRDPHNGTVLETLPATAATLTTIDRAAADLAAKIVPAVKSHLAALAKPPAQSDKITEPPARPPVQTVRAPQLPSIVATVFASRPGEPALELLATVAARELSPWAGVHRHDATRVAAEQLSSLRALTTIGENRAKLGLALEVVSFSVNPGTIPLARARVRVRIFDGTRMKFDRVVRTDTIVGDRDITEDELAARTAREVLAIVNAQLRREIAGWK